MRIKIRDILFVFLLTIVSPGGFVLLFAQDANFPGTESDELSIDIDKESEKMLYTPGELDPSFRKSQTSTYKDSTAIKPIIKSTKVQPSDSSKTPAKQPSQEDDSILSFNFLYYIFQKYKLQDSVD